MSFPVMLMQICVKCPSQMIFLSILNCLMKFLKLLPLLFSVLHNFLELSHCLLYGSSLNATFLWMSYEKSYSFKNVTLRSHERFYERFHVSAPSHLFKLLIQVEGFPTYLSLTAFTSGLYNSKNIE